MATLSTTGRNAAVAAVGTLLDSGVVEFQSSADSEVATVTFAATAFGSPAVGVITAAAMTDDSSAAGGTVAKARLYKSDLTTEILLCTTTTVGGGGDFELTSLVIGAGDKVSITSLTITQPAS
jgi:hypothetical protein